MALTLLFAIQQKYDFSSKSQPNCNSCSPHACCLQYSKSTIFQANHNHIYSEVVIYLLFAIQQKYDFSSKSQQCSCKNAALLSCLQYCKSTIFQANHNTIRMYRHNNAVVCNTAKVRFFKQITTGKSIGVGQGQLFAILQKYDFSSKSQLDY